MFDGKKVLRSAILIIAPNLPYVLLQNYYSFDRALINLDYAIPFIVMSRSKVLAAILFFALFLLDFSTAVIGHLRIDLSTAIGALRFGVAAGVVRDMSSLIDFGILTVVFGGYAAWKIAERTSRKTDLGAFVTIVFCVGLADVLVGPNRFVSHAAVNLPFNISGYSIVRASGEIAQDNVRLGPVRPAESAVGAAWREPYSNRLLLVVVESWGLPADPKEKPFLIDSLLTDAIRSRYMVQSGTVRFRNSTSGAELRELCGLEGAFVLSVRVDGQDCLPARLSREGYNTVAIHGYFGSFYDRTSWYPRLGFARTDFLHDLEKENPIERRCGAAFRGLCDVDVASIVAEELVRDPSSKQLIYWLTLSSHLPVTREAARGSNYDCAQLETENSAELCNMFRSWDVVLTSLATILTQPDLPPTDVIIVGDHAPPFVKRDQAARFSDSQVPWVALSPKTHLE